MPCNGLFDEECKKAKLDWFLASLKKQEKKDFLENGAKRNSQEVKQSFPKEVKQSTK